MVFCGLEYKNLCDRHSKSKFPIYLYIFGSKKDQAVQGISQVAGALDQSKMIKIKQHYTYNIKHVSLIKSRTLKSKQTVPPHPLGVDF